MKSDLPLKLATNISADGLKRQATGARRAATGVQSILTSLRNDLSATELKSLEQAVATMREAAAAYENAGRIRRQEDAKRATRRKEADTIVAKVFACIKTVDDKVALIGGTQTWLDTNKEAHRLLDPDGKPDARSAKWFLDQTYREVLDSISWRLAEDGGGEATAHKYLERFQAIRESQQRKHAVLIVALNQALVEQA